MILFRLPTALSSRSLRYKTTAAASTSVFVHEHKLSESTADRARKARRQASKQNLGVTNESLIPETLREMSRAEKIDERRSLAKLDVQPFPGPLAKSRIEIFQLNIGLYCNQACTHCHVESSPKRTKEQMHKTDIDQCLKIIANSPHVNTVDITGGAPELNENFRYFVKSIRDLPGRTFDIIDRCNLTVLSEPGQEDLGEFLRDHRVHVVASLPCYGEKNVNMQRGNGVFNRSIDALLRLNELGYGEQGNLKLDLVYNPIGPFLPPDQEELETQYKKRLDEDFGITFNNLFCLTNMPIKRFADFLHRRGELKEYMELLISSFNASTLDTVMCKNTLSVRYDGVLYDCDFNQQLGMGLLKPPRSIFDLNSTSELEGTEIAIDSHCYGCTAGKGSSCQGEVV